MNNRMPLQIHLLPRSVYGQLLRMEEGIVSFSFLKSLHILSAFIVHTSYTTLKLQIPFMSYSDSAHILLLQYLSIQTTSWLKSYIVTNFLYPYLCRHIQQYQYS
jgi:hypothetical protein